MSTVNKHGVCTTGETVRVRIPKSIRAQAHVYLAQLKDGWRYGWSLGTGESHNSCGPWESQPPYRSRDAALSAGLDRAVEFFLDQIKRRSSKAEIARAKSALKSITEYRGKHPHLQTEEPMNAVATEKPKRKAKATNGNGQHRTPDETGITTPAGIAANDPDAWESQWATLRPIINRLISYASIERADHQEASALLTIEPTDKTFRSHLARARRLVAKYFPGESSAVSAPSREDPPEENLSPRRGGAGNGQRKAKKVPGQVAADDETDRWLERQAATKAAEPAKSAEPMDFNHAGLTNDSAIVILAVNELERHPDNRHPQKVEIEDLAVSLLSDGQLEAIVVRRRARQAKLQILCGETRWLATKHNRHDTIRGRVIECDDARALQIVALGNAKRKDLDAIQKAKLIERLCDPLDKGGAGMTREAAGKMYGMESGAAASNLVRLLELPKIWQDRVASGDLPWTWARELLPYVGLAPVMAKLEEDWKERDDAQDSYDSVFVSRSALVDSLPHVVEQECRRLDEERYIKGQYRRLSVDPSKPEVRKQLGIVELTLPTGRKGKTETVEVATNVKAFDDLLAKAREQKAKASAENVGRDKPAPKRELSAAEKKQRAADRTRQLSARIADWRHKLLRRLLVGKLEAKEDSGFRLVMAYAAGPAYRGPDIGHVLSEATQTKKHYDQYATRSHYWPAVADCCTPGQEAALMRTMAIALLKHEASDWRSPTLPHALVERYAEDLAIDVAGGWAALQAGPKPDAMLEEFFLLFQTAEAQDLAKELGEYVPPNATRGAIVKKLIGVPPLRRLKLPKSIKPVAAVKAKGKTKPAKRGAKS